jgi:tetratricopeptide (TPR) repeat protein
MVHWRLGTRTVDLDSGRVAPDGTTLRPLERRLLAHLAARSGAVVPVEELLRDVWGYAAGTRTETVYSTVYRLRRAIEDDPRQPVHLVSVPGVGIALRGALATTQAPALQGRGAELVRLGDPESRVWVLWGPGGVGKTRLALEHARSSPISWWCPTGGVRSAEGLAEAVGRASGTDARTVDAVEVALSDAPGALVVLDGVEDLCDGAIAVVEGWVARAPRSRWLLTSRVPLGLEGGRRLPVAPLAPADAVALLTQRAVAADPTFAPSDDEVAELVDDLDRLPLALEIAAPHVARLGAAGVREALRASADLQNEQRGAPDRHRTLASVARWSIDRLSPSTQRLLGAWKVFPAAFSATASAEVADVPLAQASTALAELVAAALARREGAGFGVYGTVRQALPEPPAGTVQRFVDAMARDAVALLAAQGGLPLTVPADPSLVAAAREALRSGHPHLADLLLVGLRSATPDAAAALERATATTALPEEARVELEAWRLGRELRRRPSLEGCLRLETLAADALRAGRLAGAARLEVERARHLGNAGRPAEALAALERAERCRKELPAHAPTAVWLEAEVGLVRATLEPVATRLPWAERAVATAERTDEPGAALFARHLLALTHAAQGRPSDAERLLRALLPPLAQLPSRRRVYGEVTNRLGQVLLALDRPAEARDCATRALPDVATTPALAPYVLCTRIRANLALGDLEAAESDVGEASALARAADSAFLVSVVDALAVRLAWARGALEPAHAAAVRDRALACGAFDAACGAAACLVNHALSLDDGAAAEAALHPLLVQVVSDHTTRALELQAELLRRRGDPAGAIAALRWVAEGWDTAAAARARLGIATLEAQLGAPPGRALPLPGGSATWTRVQHARAARAHGWPALPLTGLEARPGDVLLRSALDELGPGGAVR